MNEFIHSISKNNEKVISSADDVSRKGSRKGDGDELQSDEITETFQLKNYIKNHTNDEVMNATFPRISSEDFQRAVMLLRDPSKEPLTDGSWDYGKEKAAQDLNSMTGYNLTKDQWDNIGYGVSHYLDSDYHELVKYYQYEFISNKYGTIPPSQKPTIGNDFLNSAKDAVESSN